MQRNIQQITQQFVDRLPENDQYYRLDELRSWGFPTFITRRIKIELEKNLQESMMIPKTDWANTQSDAVLDAWQKFVDTIREEARLPASYGKTVIETAVADVMEMLVQPRKNIPNIIFRTDDQLSYEQLRERLQSVVVYSHFPKLILRYMQKKEREELSKDRCKKVISDADKKLTNNYSPLNWAQMLEPLFKLSDGKIDTNLLRLFYEDKNMPRVARKFDLIDDMLTRAEFIEVLSSPELLNFEGYEDDQSKLFEDQPASSPEPESLGLQVSDHESEEEKDIKEGQKDVESKVEKTEETEEAAMADEQETPEEETENTINSGFSTEDESEDAGADTDDSTINAVFREEEEEPEIEDAIQEQPDSEDEKENAAEGEEQEETSSEEDDLKDKESTAAVAEENGQEQAADEEEESPIWMRYMSDEEVEEYQKDQEQEAEEDEVEDGFIDEPIIDLTNEDASDEEIDMLDDQLSDDRELFVEEIFRGSEMAFDQAVEDIAAYNSWRDVSKYIEKEIFKRNMVDMYSEAAVEFTDRLQSYFLQKQNQNK